MSFHQAKEIKWVSKKTWNDPSIQKEGVFYRVNARSLDARQAIQLARELLDFANMMQPVDEIDGKLPVPEFD